MNYKETFFEPFRSRSHPSADQILRSTVAYGGTELKRLLAECSSNSLSNPDIRTVIGGNLWMLTPEAYSYFLPAFMRASLKSYQSLSIFVSEFLGSLTKPTREDIEEGINRLSSIPDKVGLSEETLEKLREQQMEWYESGTPGAIFHQRATGFTHTEGKAVLTFLETLRKTHGEDFPFDEIDEAIDRHWVQYQE